MVAFLTVSLREVATLAQTFLAITTLGGLWSESRTSTWRLWKCSWFNLGNSGSLHIQIQLAVWKPAYFGFPEDAVFTEEHTRLYGQIILYLLHCKGASHAVMYLINLLEAEHQSHMRAPGTEKNLCFFILQSQQQFWWSIALL